MVKSNKKAADKDAQSMADKIKAIAANADQRRKVIDADNPLTLVISEAHIKNAVCKDPMKCVVGRAIGDHFGPGVVTGWAVGTNITKIFTPTHIIRYSTPHRIATAVRVFDVTSEWGLPAGQYTLLPLSKSYRRGNRWNKKRNSGKRPRDSYNGVQAPTRFSPNILQLGAESCKSKKDC